MAEELLLTGQCVLPRQLEEEGFAFHYPTAEAALDDLTHR
jgi:NAD dependent epimerase/dehydratase family enzyme